MKRLYTIIFLLIFFASYPIIAFGENWGESDRSIDEMLEDEKANMEMTEDNEEKRNDSTNDEEEMMTDQDENEQILSNSRGQNIFFLLLKMFLALGIIIFMIYALLKLFHSRSKRFSGHSTLENIGGIALGQNKSVQIIRIGNKLYVIGVGDSVQLLKEISDENEINKILEERKQEDLFDQPISLISKWLRQRMKQDDPEQEKSFQQLLERKLSEVRESQTKVHTVLKGKNDD